MLTKRVSSKIIESKRKQCEKWINENIQEGPIRALAEAYWQQSIVVYTGSGVSTGPTIKGIEYGLPTWFSLLQKIAANQHTTSWPNDPWHAADMAVRHCGGRTEFKNRLERLIMASHNYTTTNGQLNGTFVRAASTLSAVAAFCGQLTGRITNPKVENPTRVHFRTSANHRIQAILTANYDCFLETAASNFYRKSPLKPVTALGSLAGITSRIPVFHIHGYVPHPFYKRENREQIIDDLIITRQDYEKYWKTDDVFGTTMGPQIHYFRYFTVLFVGFSFTDEYVCKLLQRVYKDYLSHSGHTHFALLQTQKVQEKGISFFQNMGITPIEYKEHDEIPSILGQIYKTGLAADRIIEGKTTAMKISLPELLVKTHTPTQRLYYYSLEDAWKIMQACRNESVHSSLVHDVEAISD